MILIPIAVFLPEMIGEMRQGHPMNASKLVLTVLVIFVIQFVSSWNRRSRAIDELISKQGDEPVHYQFDLDSITSESVVGKISRKWNSFKRLTINSHEYLLKLPRGQGTIAWPAEQVTPELSDFLIARFTEQGITVRK